MSVPFSIISRQVVWLAANKDVTGIFHLNNSALKSGTIDDSARRVDVMLDGKLCVLPKEEFVENRVERFDGMDLHAWRGPSGMYFELSRG